jgi:hypothetical protein
VVEVARHAAAAVLECGARWGAVLAIYSIDRWLNRFPRAHITTWRLLSCVPAKATCVAAAAAAAGASRFTGFIRLNTYAHCLSGWRAHEQGALLGAIMSMERDDGRRPAGRAGGGKHLGQLSSLPSGV